VVGACRERGVKLSVMPPMRAMLGTAVQLNHIAEMPVIEYGTWGTSSSTKALKRGVDIVLSAVGIVVLAPLMLIIAIAVRLTSRGPALFKQVRAGRGGRAFRMYKFRTMCRDAEERINEVISPDELTEPMFKLRRDPRVTKVGRYLRRTSLDELPQLFNVLGRQMSLVGPRPAIPYELAHYRPADFDRFSVRPGLTGLWQVSGRSELGFREMLELDVEYARNATLATDARILARTPRAVLGRTA
jgi:exopolysaccharide biosynthesis polyprenyl glycosylphosphotransferase